jgi:hypothetical protein
MGEMPERTDEMSSSYNILKDMVIADKIALEASNQAITALTRIKQPLLLIEYFKKTLSIATVLEEDDIRMYEGFYPFPDNRNHGFRTSVLLRKSEEDKKWSWGTVEFKSTKVSGEIKMKFSVDHTSEIPVISTGDLF